MVAPSAGFWVASRTLPVILPVAIWAFTKIGAIVIHMVNITMISFFISIR
jgi:hypothetical protein